MSFNHMCKSLLFTVAIFLFGSADLLSQNLNVDFRNDAYILIVGCSEIDNGNYMVSIVIESVTGGSGSYTITPGPGGFVSNSLINEGEGFVFYFSNEAQQNATIDFTIDDGAGNIYQLDPTIAVQLELVPVQLCDDSWICLDLIEHTDSFAAIPLDYETQHTIISSGKVLFPGLTTYRAPELISLEAGFEVNAGSDFSAEIGTCQ